MGDVKDVDDLTRGGIGEKMHMRIHARRFWCEGGQWTSKTELLFVR